MAPLRSILRPVLRKPLSSLTARYGGGFSPANISNLAMMLDINDITTVELDGWNGAGTYVTDIKDQSENGYDHTNVDAGTAGTPFLDTDEEALFFKGSEQTTFVRLTADGVWQVPDEDGAEFTICAMVKIAAATADYIYSQYQDAQNYISLRDGFCNFTVEVGDTKFIVLATTTQMPDNEWTLLTYRVKRTVSQVLTHNKEARTLYNQTNNSGNTSFSGGASYLMAKDNITVGSDGYFKALLIYDKLLSDEEVGQIYDYYK